MRATVNPLEAGAFAEQFAVAVKLAIKGEHVEAAKRLQLFPSPKLPPISRRNYIPPSRQVSVFRRDKFTCRYCGRGTVFCPLLRMMAALFPGEFSFHSHWRMTDCHIAFWRDSASCDHLVPVARGGSSEPENLITACYMCNSIKQNWLIEELGWTLRPVTPDSWDGLSSLYTELAKVAPEGQRAHHRAWQVALRQTATR